MPDMSLGRVHIPDDRDQKFPMTLHLGPVHLPSVPSSRTWRGQVIRLDQGQRGACVGFAGANWMGHAPIQDKVSNTTGNSLYDECKKIDGIPDIEGTYDRALAKVLVAQGRIERYLWAQTPDELKAWVLTTGPAMVGTNWYGSMFNPDESHRLWISGTVAGGHEWLIRGWSRKRLTGDMEYHGYYRMRNSWSAQWGDKGEAWIREELVNRLVFEENGDALGAVEKRP